MDVAPPTPKTTPTFGPTVPWAWLLVPVALFIAVGMSALASIPIAILAVPVAFLLTHDNYVALLSVSYGPFAAAQVMVCVALAAALWGVLVILGHGHARRALWGSVGGAAAGAVGLWLAPVAQLAVIDPAWHYGPALPFTLPNILVATLAGGIAGIALLRTDAVGAQATTWRALFARLAGTVALFALVLAMLLEVWAALTSLRA